MSLNCSEIEEVIKYIPKEGIIKGFDQTSKNDLIISYYNRNGNYNLLINTQDKFNRISLIPEKEKFKTGNFKFAQFLNASLSGGKIKDIFQFDLQRIIVILIEYADQIKKIVCRLWGNGGNILYTDNENYVIECLKRFPKREEWPDEEFIFKQSDNTAKEFKIRDEFKTEINRSVYYYYKELSDKEEFNQRKNKNLSVIEKEIELFQSSLKKANDNLNSLNYETYYYYGDLLKANIYKVKKGDKRVKLYDYEKEFEVEIEIDDKLTPSGNVEKFYNKYKKAKEGKIKWEEQRDNIKEKLDDYLDLKNILLKINKLEEVIDFETNLLSGKLARILKEKKEQEKRTFGKSYMLSDGYIAYVSRSSKDADEMLNKVAKGNDYWFHIRDYAGSHVIVKEIKNKEITEKIKQEGALLALYFSKGKKADEGDIYFTRVKYLHKAKGSGLVLPTQEKNIKVKFNKELLEKIIGEK